MSGASTVVVYGGSFNPPHVAHVLAVAYVLSTMELERVYVVPVYDHVFDKDLAPFEQRIALCRAAFGWLPQVQVSDVEAHLPWVVSHLAPCEHSASDEQVALQAPVVELQP